MTVALSPLFVGYQVLNHSGLPNAGGFIYVYQAGTSTPAITYTDSSGTIANTNPIQLDAAGYIPDQIWVDPGSSYKFVVESATGTILGTYDNIPGWSALNIGFSVSSTAPYGTVARALVDRGICVTDAPFNADPTGTNDSTAAFSSAAKAIASSAAYSNITGIAVAPVVKVRVPAPGMYTVGSLVDVGNYDVIWEIEEGASVSNYNNLNGRISVASKRISSNTYGIFDYATGFGVRANPSDLGQGSQVLGLTSSSGLATYSGRDSVALFADNYGPPPLNTQSTASYTATTATLGTALTTAQMEALRVGMIVDTLHATKWSGFLTSWTSTTLTVSAWYQSGGTSGTPASGTGLVISPITKIWAHNANNTLDASSYATAATGFELGTLNNKASNTGPGQNPSMWGYDSVSLGSYTADYAYIARGAWFFGYYAQGSNAGFYYSGTGNSFFSQDNAGNTTFQVNNNGTLEIGNQGVAQTTTIDFHSSGSPIDFDVRLYSTGGSSTTAGQGAFRVQAAVMEPICDVRPYTDNTNAIGGPSNRWTAVYAVNGTIQTSDPSLKTDIADLPQSLPLVRDLTPKTYRWKIGGQDLEWVDEEQGVQATQTVEQEIEDHVVENGKAIVRKKIVTREVPVFDEYPVFDDQGDPVYDAIKTHNGQVLRKQRIHKVPRMVKKMVKVQKPVEREGKRTHWGFLATDVRDVFAKTGRDFAGYVLAEDGTHHMRPDQLLPVLWKAVQELAEEVAALKAKAGA